MSDGQKLLELITSNNLFSIECTNCGKHDGFIIVWSLGAEEQLDAMINEINKGKRT